MMAARSPVGAPSPNMNFDRGRSYFPDQQQPIHGQQQQQQPLPQQQPQYYASGPDAETISNTLANTHLPQSGHDHMANAPQSARFNEEWDAGRRGSSIVDGTQPHSTVYRTNSYAGSVNGLNGDGTASISRSNTLKKKASLRRSGSLKRSGSRRSMKAGSVRSLALQPHPDQEEVNSAFYCPVPTAGSPTEVLANRFQAWRKILKDLITFFKEIQTHYEHRSKSLIRLGNVLNNTSTPPGFLSDGGLDDALQVLRNYNKQAIAESNKAREIEEDVILALTGLRSDLHQKIKEIKNLSGDFKNSVDKEMEATRRAVNSLQEILGKTDLDPALTTGKEDPYLLRLAVDRQLERQIDEENYLHQAYLNLESSGRELESIVVGEIQKSYNAYAGILKRESDVAYSAIEELRIGPISMPKDTEWNSFIRKDEQFVDPDVPMRSAEFIHYPGRDHHACQEIRAGLLERKSKYLKSYSAGWYVLSPTHLHEFRSADKGQGPVMSLYLPEQKLGSHSTEGSSSNKFILKGRQTGTMHRGHTWVFRAESHDTMMAWYEDIKMLTERTPEERTNFLRGHGRSYSRSSQRSSISSDGVNDDEEPPFSANVAYVNQPPRQDGLPRRPSGGRFPSDLQVNAQRHLQVPVSPLSVSSGNDENGIIDATAATTLPGSAIEQRDRTRESNPPDCEGPTLTAYQGDYTYTNPNRSQARHFNNDLDGQPLPMPHTAGNQGDGVIRKYSEQTDGRRISNPDMTLLASRNHEADEQSVRHGQRSVDSDIRGFPVSMGAHQAVSSTEVKSGTHNGIASTSAQHPSHAMPRTVMVGQMDSNNGGGGFQDRTRPNIEGMRNDSVPTISHLHIPGEYPKNSS
ncbi:hypothetical protein QBC32DRAFT_217939 [Pseudoneurospora amorphoporcata]|uniref:PH domain-containing protein n=1 Tax=Pseudoneurospora amorphoporcata TaxID=241081 RepID=A0AAN6SE22_9PEZI|nr:hypothetical protein QBC32DRAFT_217939 [Pseudoneurospora amorphoporcata]